MNSMFSLFLSLKGEETCPQLQMQKHLPMVIEQKNVWKQEAKNLLNASVSLKASKQSPPPKKKPQTSKQPPPQNWHLVAKVCVV